MPRRDLPTEIASTVEEGADARLHAPSAQRNADAITDAMRQHAPTTGQALEIASGTGEHALAFAAALPRLTWQPTDIGPERLASIDAWAALTPMLNLRPAAQLDAVLPGWGKDWAGQNLVFLCNLLHLISTPEARTIISETATALAPKGRFIFYGPFLREGQPTSDGDARFHASLRAADPETGYKDMAEVLGWCDMAGLRLVAQIDMPANNLLFVTQKE